MSRVLIGLHQIAGEIFTSHHNLQVITALQSAGRTSQSCRFTQLHKMSSHPHWLHNNIPGCSHHRKQALQLALSRKNTGSLTKLSCTAQYTPLYCTVQCTPLYCTALLCTEILCKLHISTALHPTAEKKMFPNITKWAIPMQCKITENLLCQNLLWVFFCSF